MREAIVCRPSHTRSRGRLYTWVLFVLATLVVPCHSRVFAERDHMLVRISEIQVDPEYLKGEDIEAIAEQAFIRAFRITEHHDLAAQISDDLRLLAEAGVAGYRSSTLDGIWSAYSSGQFPDRLR